MQTSKKHNNLYSVCLFYGDKSICLFENCLRLVKQFLKYLFD